MKRTFTLSMLGLLAVLWLAPAQAARIFTITQVSPALGTAFDMGSAQSVTFSVMNTSGGGNAGERLYEIRLRLPGTGTVFASSTAAPAGWTRTAFNTTSVTFRASSWANSIVSGSSLNFTLNMVMRTTTADVSETLRDARASFTLDTNFADGISRTGRVTVNNPGSWTLKSLLITSFQTTDVGGTPVSAIAAGTSFRVAITVQNISSATQSTITANPPGLTIIKFGTWGGSSPSCSVTSTIASLAPGASGTIIYTCTTLSSDSGTVSFSANARNGSNNATSRTVSSNTLSVSAFAATLVVQDPVTGLPVPGNCAYVNQTLRVRMGLINNNNFAITGITPTLTPTVAGIVTLVSGPTPATNTIAAGPGATTSPAFDWIYQITGGTSGQLFAFTGSASGTAQPPGSGARTTPNVTTSPTTKRGGFDPIVNPISTNASSTNAEINWGIINNGCAPVKSISISIPAGFTWNSDAYSLINSTDESWTVSGTNPVIFTAPAAVNYLPLGFDADFYLVLSTPTVSVSTPITFDLGVTDSNNVFSTRATTLVIDPFNSGTPSLNFTAPWNWREKFQ